MKLKLLTCFAWGLGAALLLGACSGGNPSGTPSGSETGTLPQAPSENGDDSLSEIITRATEAAEKAAAEGSTDEDRANARELIKAAIQALDDAVKRAQEAVRSATTAAERGAAERARSIAIRDQTTHTRTLNEASASFAWYGTTLARYQFAMGTAPTPRAATSVVTVNNRIPRTIRTSLTDSTLIANPAAFTSNTFKDVMYADGKEVFSTTDDAEGGDEFKVDGWVGWPDTEWTLEQTTYTGLKLTDTGIVIRTGGTTGPAAYTAPTSSANALYNSDFTDMRRDITKYVNDADGATNANDEFAAETPHGQNGWDLVLTFGEPLTTPVPVGVPVGEPSKHQASRMGNGDFYWRSFVPPHSSQSEPGGEYYSADAFNQPAGFESLGIYEVWLSNHAGTILNTEPNEGSGAIRCLDSSIGTSCPHDDEPFYLKYAAYGLFVFTPSAATFLGDDDSPDFGYKINGRAGRINTLHFGYSAFSTAAGQRTTDIGETISGGRYNGHTLAYETKGARDPSGDSLLISNLLRGDVVLTVSIPKGTGTGTLEGTLNNFHIWNEEGNYWTTYGDNFTVTLQEADISPNGSFVGSTETVATGYNEYTSRRTGGTGLNPVYTVTSSGIFKGNFYGPRNDNSDLEIAGSWTIGAKFGSDYSNPDLVSNGRRTDLRKSIYGSFGARQKPAQ